MVGGGGCCGLLVAVVVVVVVRYGRIRGIPKDAGWARAPGALAHIPASEDTGISPRLKSRFAFGSGPLAQNLGKCHILSFWPAMASVSPKNTGTAHHCCIPGGGPLPTSAIAAADCCSRNRRSMIDLLQSNRFLQEPPEGGPLDHLRNRGR